MLAIVMTKYPIYLLSHLQSIFITFISFHIIPSQEFTFPWKTFVSLDFDPNSSILIIYSS